jgi:hypothetical protein
MSLPRQRSVGSWINTTLPHLNCFVDTRLIGYQDVMAYATALGSALLLIA